MQNKHSFLELYGVDSAIRATDIVFDHLNHAGATKALERLGSVVLPTSLRKVQSVAEKLSHTYGECHQILFGATYPGEWLFFGGHV